jgi:hypothetical protein
LKLSWPSSRLRETSAQLFDRVRAERARREADRRPLFRWTTEPSDPPGEFVTFDPDGTPAVHIHAGQDRARTSAARFVLVLAGAQSGKTALGPWWLLDEMKARGPGNYLLVAPTFRLLDKQAVPTLNRALGTILKVGHLVGGSSGEFRISEAGHKRIWPDTPYEPTRIVFGYAENPDSLESLMAKAAWLDECGQRAFKRESHEAIQARLAIHRGRILYTSTPYQHGWLKTDVYDRAERNRRAEGDAERARAEGREPLPPNPADVGYDAVSYESRMNPVFSQEEWDRQKLVLPAWRFDMRYRGRFTRPAGLIYDCFDPAVHVMPGKDFQVPPGWPIYVGVDFGAPNFAAVFFCEVMEPWTAWGSETSSWRKLNKPQYVAFAEYRPDESKTVAAHVRAMRAIAGRNPDLCVGGAKSEGQWRSEAAAAGWPINAPDQPDVEIGIDRMRALLADHPPRLRVMDTCPRLLEEIVRYSRPVDDSGTPLEGIEDADEFHGLDSSRYLCSWLGRTSAVGAWVF